MKQLEHSPQMQEALQAQAEVVELAERKNWPNPMESWLMKGESGPQVITSVATTGTAAPNERVELAGSMSPAWGQPYDSRTRNSLLGGIGIDELNLMPVGLKELTDEKREYIKESRKAAASEQMHRFLETIGGDNFANDVIVIKPQSDHYADRSVKGNIVCADDVERTGDYIEDTRPAFMMYSTDPERVVAIRPADCPTNAFTAYKTDGTPIHGFMHGGWQDEDAGFIHQGLDFLAEQGVDMSTMKVYIAPGGVEFDYSRPTNPKETQDDKFTNEIWKERITDVTENDNGVEFIIDMQGFAVDELRRFGITDEQIFIDSTDTAAPETGHASHKQASRSTIPPMRDIVLVMSPEKQLDR